jgi:DNA modification methylase
VVEAVIHHGDCVEVMAGMEPESVDAIVTDPPYGLEFMGKSWDRLWNRGVSDFAVRPRGGFSPFTKPRPQYEAGPAAQAWHEAWAREALRVAKPGAYLLAFGGTRTVHRLACAIEDAGWIIRDTLVWAYAQGFPKSKASLKPAWEPIVMARKPGPLRELAIDACRIPMVTVEGAGLDVNTHLRPDVRRAVGESVFGTSETEQRYAIPPGRWPANVILTDPIFDGGIKGVVGGGETTSGKMLPTDVSHGDRTVFGSDAAAGYTTIETYGDTGTYSRFFALPITIGACRYCGVRIADGSSQGSPTLDTRSDIAREPASSPRNSSRSVPAPSALNRSDEVGENTARPNAELWAGADDGSRSDDASTSGIAARSSSESEPTTPRTPRNRQPATSPGSTLAAFDPASPADRSETSSDTTTTTPDRWMCGSCADLVMRSFMDEPGFAEQPDSPRFLLIPKADRSDREPVLGGLPVREQPSTWGDIGPVDGNPRKPATGHISRRSNTHPTVKPTELMRHLVRLVTPFGGTVLDPFAGSGSTLIAAEQEGFQWIGIEKEAEYVAIAEARLNGTQRGLGLSA